MCPEKTAKIPQIVGFNDLIFCDGENTTKGLMKLFFIARVNTKPAEGLRLTKLSLSQVTKLSL